VLHSCTECSKVFPKKGNLNRHLGRKFEEVDSDSDEAWKRVWKRQDKVGNTGKTYFAKWRYQLDKSCTVEEDDDDDDDNEVLGKCIYIFRAILKFLAHI